MLASPSVFETRTPDAIRALAQLAVSTRMLGLEFQPLKLSLKEARNLGLRMTALLESYAEVLVGMAE